MNHLCVKNIDIPSNPLDERNDISAKEADGPCACFCLSVILMSDPTAMPPKATFDAVIGYVRAVRAGFEQAVSGLDHPPTDAALSYATGMKAGLDTTIITLEHLARLTSTAAQIGSASSVQAKPGFPTCADCGFIFGPHAKHVCSRDNSLTPLDLDGIFGEDGWIGLGEAVPTNDQDQTARPAGVDDHETGLTQPDLKPAQPLGMREGSKKHRVYEATRKLLEANGPMHIDEMLKSVSEVPGVFSAVKDRRTNYANILSALRSKGLVESDNRGTYSLPNGKAAE